MTTLNKEEARQGETRNEVRWILMISTGLAVLVLFAFLFFNMGANSDDTNAQAPATSENIEITDTSIYLV